MELVKATVEEHWKLASDFLIETVERCNRNNVPLWTYEQVSIASLKQQYCLEGLYLLKYDNVFVGCVFISFDSDVFWQDRDTTGSLFFHKLAISSQYNAKGLGEKTLAAIVTLAKSNHCVWLRCDCHGARPRLRAFYEQFGFQLVDRKERLGFDVARYQTKC